MTRYGRPSFYFLSLKSHRLFSNPSLVWPRSRRSVCFPAEAYPPLRSPAVYLHELLCAMAERKKSLILAALSDMVIDVSPNQPVLSWKGHANDR